MERSRIAIVIPALNESATIEAVLKKVSDYGIPIVVDDGSTDMTGEIAQKAGAEVVRHAVNRGYDAALNSGFMAAAAMDLAYVITMDADGQHNPEQLGDFIQCLDNGYEIVLGVRDRTQRIGEAIFAAVSKGLWGMSDPLCGMKGYSIGVYRRAGTFDSFNSIGTLLATRSIAAGSRFTERSVITRDRSDAPRFGRRLHANVKILRALSILVYRYFTNQLVDEHKKTARRY